MVKDGKTAVVPKLRFPEFEASEEWEKKPLSSMLDYERPEKYIVSDTAYLSSGVPVLTANKSFILGYTSETAGIYTDTPVIIFDDFTTDRKYVDFPFKVKSSAIKILRAKGDDSLKLIFELMCTIKFDPKEHKRYYISEYQNLEISLPNGAEQQKIANCLSSLDELIAAQGRKVESLKAYKRGLMQQLFPREGETLPRLRFPEFRDSPEWADEKLGKHVDIWSGYSPSTFALSSSGRYPYVKVEDLNNCIKYQITGREFCDDDGGVIPKQSLVFPKRGAAIELNKIRITQSQIQIDTNLMALTPKKGLTIEFLFYYISNVGLAHIADTSTIPQINNKHIIPFVFRCPSVAEQQRIADFLSSLDAKIAAGANKLAALRTHKQGLMQELFPSLEEA